jgi:hypothetical protein
VEDRGVPLDLIAEGTDDRVFVAFGAAARIKQRSKSDFRRKRALEDNARKGVACPPKLARITSPNRNSPSLMDSGCPLSRSVIGTLAGICSCTTCMANPTPLVISTVRAPTSMARMAPRTVSCGTAGGGGGAAMGCCAATAARDVAMRSVTISDALRMNPP